MSSLLKAKQLVLLLQDGFRALGELTPTQNLINALRIELNQLKEIVNDLDCLRQFSDVFSALENLLATVSEVDFERLEVPIYSPENIQIILEALRIISNQLAEVVGPNNINIQDLAAVLNMLGQQKSAEIKSMVEAQKPSTTKLNETIFETGIEINNDTASMSEVVSVPENQIETAEGGISNENSETLQSATNQTALNSIQNEEVRDSLNSVSIINYPPPPLSGEEKTQLTLSGEVKNVFQPEIEEKDKKLGEQSRAQILALDSLPTQKGQNSFEPYLIVRACGKLFAIFNQAVEKVVKLSLAELKLVSNEIFISLDGNEIALYDIASLFGESPQFDSPTIFSGESFDSNRIESVDLTRIDSTQDDHAKETFLAAVLLTKSGKIGLLCDEILGLEKLTMTKFQSVLGKIKGIAGIATFYTKTQSTEQEVISEIQCEPIFVLKPSELIPNQDELTTK